MRFIIVVFYETTEYYICMSALLCTVYWEAFDNAYQITMEPYASYICSTNWIESFCHKIVLQHNI